MNKIAVIIVLKGGMVTDVYASYKNVNVDVIDFDVQDEEELEAADKCMDIVMIEVNKGKLVAVY